MTYEVLIIIVALNALATVSLWRKVASKSSRGPQLNKKAADALWRGEPVKPKHDPPNFAKSQWSFMADDVHRQFFDDFRKFADVANWWFADEYNASRFRLQDLPDETLSLNVRHDDGPSFGRSFSIYYNQTRVGRLEISPGHGYTTANPEVYTSLEIDFGARFLGFDELSDFLHAVAFHVTTGVADQSDYQSARLSIQSALTKTLWDNYRVSQYDNPDDEQWGELNVSFNGTADFFKRRRDAPARPQ
ncbi:hypothetical protein [Bradyrhizobium valentinum]|uniref:Uncharacterized protein n=1 Tax=Bradyrhizobium valentinum TaxID=1518501 RepID=A0A0R3M4J7_9BRAD|nr:hypothetical protein [Bradyrhizobium valentinum]KRR14542.1 hypothetical protein CP49_25865 [Bradyrhizobium valentinum]